MRIEMRYKEPIKEIFSRTINAWDRDETRLAVRENFRKAFDCRTPILGGQMYASENEEKIFFNTCKGRSCASCGHRATELWQIAQMASLPNIPFTGITFTMPNILWPVFKQNRHLLHDLPALGAKVIKEWVKLKYGVRILIIVVGHTFGRHLNFNAHLHILVSSGGLQEFEGQWIPCLDFDKKALMHMWRYTLITFLRTALRMAVLASDSSDDELKRIFTKQYERWWSIYIDKFKSKWHLLRYATRYIRRPPIAQHRFVKITDREVVFWTKDLKLKRRVLTRYSLEEFVSLLGEHVPDRYRHAMRYFGLFAPRIKSRTWAALFVLLGQERRLPPRRLSWAESLQKHFGVDPLVDSHGQRMHWIRGILPSGT